MSSFDDGGPSEATRVVNKVVPIKSADGLDVEWSMIEVQGAFEAENGTVDGAHIGKFEVKGATPHLSVGIHQLEGKFVALPKPLVVLSQGGAAGKEHFTVTGVVRNKALFKLRPKVVLVPEA